jgi:hypothetical protein
MPSSAAPSIFLAFPLPSCYRSAYVSHYRSRVTKNRAQSASSTFEAASLASQPPCFLASLPPCFLAASRSRAFLPPPPPRAEMSQAGPSLPYRAGSEGNSASQCQQNITHTLMFLWKLRLCPFWPLVSSKSGHCLFFVNQKSFAPVPAAMRNPQYPWAFSRIEKCSSPKNRVFNTRFAKPQLASSSTPQFARFGDGLMDVLGLFLEVIHE